MYYFEQNKMLIVVQSDMQYNAVGEKNNKSKTTTSNKHNPVQLNETHHV